jgi:hypothetical protein
VFSTYTNGAGITYVVFGDGVTGRIPPSGSSIYVSYRYSDITGSLGNVAANTVTVFAGDNIPPLVTVTNASALSGGADAESTDSIRVNAPAALRSLNRAVSLADYGQLALQVSGVSKAAAIGTSFNSIILYIAAAGGALTTSAFKTAVSNYFSGKTPPAASLTVLDFTPVYPYLTVSVDVLPQYNAANVGTAVADALYTLFAFDNVTFGDVITQGDVQASIKAIDGVNLVTLTDYEKLPALYSMYAITTASTTTGSTTLTVDSTAGLWAGARVAVTSGTGVLATTTTIASITNSTTAVLSAAPTTTIATGATITAYGNAGTSDLVCAVSEVPVLNIPYITVTTTGGST